MNAQENAGRVPLAAHIKAQRNEIFKAMSIIDMCRCATASMFEMDDPEHMAPALETAHDLLNGVASNLADIANKGEVALAEEQPE